MKLIIDMPDKVVEEILQAPEKPSRAFLGGAFLYLREALRVATPIPDNATNEDVVNLIFPDGFDISDFYWWKKPYKGGE